MKMREELELYRTKTIELEDVLRAKVDEYELYREAQRDDFENKIRTLIGAHTVQFDELVVTTDKKFKDKDDQYQRRQADVTRLQEQINNLQDILDVIPGVMARNKSDGYSENTCHVRLASVLAQKFM